MLQAALLGLRGDENLMLQLNVKDGEEDEDVEYAMVGNSIKIAVRRP
jgi:hypothetical protein